MSTWTSRVALLGALVALSGCLEGIDVSRRAPEAISVAGDSVVIAGPPGYCIDRSATRDTTSGSFVLLGSCASIARDADLPRPAAPAVLTVTVSPGLSDGTGFRRLLGDLRSFFETEEGRRALSRTGEPDSVEVLQTRIVDDALYIHAVDTGAADRGVEAEYWRALFGLNNRLVTVSVVGVGAPISDDAGRLTLDAFTDRIRTANTGGAG